MFTFEATATPTEKFADLLHRNFGVVGRRGELVKTIQQFVDEQTPAPAPVSTEGDDVA